MAALAANDTSSRNPNAATRPRLAARARTNRDTDMGGGSIFQIVLSESCISPNTPEAVTKRVTMPTKVARVPAVL